MGLGFSDISHAKKLMGAFMAVALLAAGVGFIGWRNTVGFSSEFKSLYDRGRAARLPARGEAGPTT